MPTDFLVYGVTQPLGLLLMGSMILVGYGFWRLVLGNRYRDVGMMPFALAYVVAFAGLVIINFWVAYDEYSSRVLRGLLQETERWSHVRGWTLYLVTLWLPFLLLMLAFIGVPLAARLIKSDRFSYKNIAVSAVVFCFGFAVVFWGLVTAINGWHDPQSPGFFLIVSETLPGVAFIAVPFLLAVYLASVRKLRAANLQNPSQ